MTENNNEALKQQLDDIRTVIGEAQSKIENNEVVDLSGLNLKTQDICRDVLALPPAQAKEFKGAMLDMIATLNTLELSLKNFQGEMTKLKENLE